LPANILPHDGIVTNVGWHFPPRVPILSQIKTS
jgi:hypothetical protein